MFASEIPSPMKGLLRNFAPLLSRPQQENLARTVVGMMTTEGEKCVKNVNDSFVPHKDQSNLNRFITDPKWDYRALNERRVALVEDELGLKGSELCYLLLDDTNVERYGGEGVGYHHDSKHGMIKGHNYVTEVCSVVDGTLYPVDLRLYMPEGTSSKPFRSKIELACELIDAFDPPSRRTIVEFDEWYLCGDVVKHVEERGFDWMSEAKSNRVLFHGVDEQGKGERLRVDELAERMRPFFRDVEVDGELYQCLDTEAYMPKVGETRLLLNCRADTKDIHYACTNILREREGSTTATILRRALKRAEIESFHWDIKNVLGFGDYRFRGSDAAIIHSHLVLLTYSLLLIAKRRVERREALEDKEERSSRHSIGEACRWMRDRCIVAFCRWIGERLSQGTQFPKILAAINPRLRSYK
ncbi:MAG: transposase [Thaumarchaeota archaeon]|nr:MAG: transposase [Nitrososphaerota archaeon]